MLRARYLVGGSLRGWEGRGVRVRGVGVFQGWEVRVQVVAVGTEN